MDNRSDLINQLANEFNSGDHSTIVSINKSNYIPEKNALESVDLDITILKQTRAVIEEHEKKFQTSKDYPDKDQILAHLYVAKRCINDIINQKTKESLRR